MLEDLRRAAEAAGNPAWGTEGGPHDSGTYCCRAEHTGFFHPDCGNWRSDYGKFFLEWYSGMLLRYVERMVSMGNRVLAEPRRPRSVRPPLVQLRPDVSHLRDHHHLCDHVCAAHLRSNPSSASAALRVSTHVPAAACVDAPGASTCK